MIFGNILQGKNKIDVIVQGSYKGVTVDISDSYYEDNNGNMTTDIQVIARCNGHKVCNARRKEINELSDSELRQALLQIANRIGINLDY